MKPVLVIGAGIAGLSACATLVELGLPVRLVASGPCASEFSCGAFDFHPWTLRDDHAIQPELATPSKALLAELGFALGKSHVATSEGVIRSAEGVFDRVLELEALSSKVVGVLDVGRFDFHAVRLARELGRSDWAKATHTRFVPLEMSAVFTEAERRLPLAAFARLLDEPEKFRSWQEALLHLSSAQSTLEALLCGPWLGSRPWDRSHHQGLLVGETLSPPDGSLGARFRLARERFLARRGLTLETRRARSVDGVDEGGVRVVFDSTMGERAEERFEAVVVAAGGVFGGGIGWLRPDPTAEISRAVGPRLVSPLDPRPGWIGGSWEGFDASSKGAAWLKVGQSHGVMPHEEDSRIQFAGDVVLAEQGNGTLGRAVLSGASAARRIATLLGPVG